jgi:regulator of replication initiation timing
MTRGRRLRRRAVHIVTKFLVVVAAILSVLLSGLVVAYSFNYRTVKDDYQRMVGLNNSLNSTIAEHSAVLARQQQAAERSQSALQSEISALRSQLDTVQGVVADLRRENERLRVAEGASSARIDEFTALLGTYANLDERRSEELDRLRERQLASAQREIEYLDRINDLSGQLENATETNRSLQIQLAQLREQLETAQFGGSGALATAGNREGARRAPADFRGRVLSVRTDASGITYAAINAGTSDQLAERMRFNIVRDGQFIATVQLQRVDLNEAVGIIDTLGREVQIREGDIVLPTL